ALEYGCEIIEIETTKEDKLINRLRMIQPDLIIVIAFRILPKSILSIPKMGSINLHASLLPKYRGPAPINWAIINGDEKTGNTVFFLDSGVDKGLIINQSHCKITPDMTTGELYLKLMNQGPEIIIKSINEIASGIYSEFTQDESKVSKAPKLFKADANINFAQPATNVHNQIRGMNPWPGSHSFFRGKLVKILEARESGLTGEIPGEIISLEEGEVTIACGEGSVIISKVAPQGKKSMSASSFINGYNPECGERFIEGE
ncbi:MAG: methionyl-tRNA formyltransferase, partial [Spirochaetales bacterium]|nr:methionyl-tRNA formyltransferase [Spirochaetales bacterium]